MNALRPTDKLCFSKLDVLKIALGKKALISYPSTDGVNQNENWEIK